ncbi:MAG: hypothetical protein Q9203_001937 [Teloschistes exilis]
MTPPPSPLAPTPTLPLRLKINLEVDPNQSPAKESAATESDSMPRPNAARRNEPAPPPKFYIIKATEGWRPSDNPQGKIDCKILGVYSHCASANMMAHQYLREQWPEQYRQANEVKKDNGAVSLEMETDKEDGIVFLDIEEHDVDKRYPWEMA